MSEQRANSAGDLRVGEASAVVRDLQYRANGSMFGMYVALAVLVAVSVFGGYFLVNALAPGEGWGGLVGLVLAIAVYRMLWRKLAVGRFRKRFAEKGMPLELPLRVEIGPDALVSEIGGVKRIVQWPVVTELFDSHGYWIFLAQGDAIIAPQRFFSSTEEQRLFIVAALSYMTDAAKRRSSFAAAFAAAV